MLNQQQIMRLEKKNVGIKQNCPKRIPYLTNEPTEGFVTMSRNALDTSVQI